MDEQQDEWVAAAKRNWAARFMAAGVSYGDYQATVSRILRWDQWLAEWSVTAREYETFAERAEERGAHRSAAEAWRRAALCWHFGKFVAVEDARAAAHAQGRANACYDRGLSSLSPPGEKVFIPYQGVRLGALLRRPPGVQRPPVVVLLPGLDSTKEELQPVAEYFLERGLATLAVDGPGQGETEAQLPIEAAWERPIGAILDFLGEQANDLDADRVGCYGISLGGYYVIRAAAFEPRLKAVVDNAGPYAMSEYWANLPPMTRATLQHRTGAGNPEDALQRTRQLDLSGIAERVQCPLLVIHGTADPIIPFSDAERIAREAPNVQLMRFENGNHGCTNYLFQSRSGAADWLAEHLGGTR
ncbi:MAG: alpha/beta fold hydrolase [Chloroflexi bacterium]|nr:alpha/beta fold hydrolase [Chloroflexota bacterium]